MTTIDTNKLPRHIAVIMDGNGRWAKKKKKGRIHGHQKGADSVNEIVKASLEIGIKWLTLYAFSEENWDRPKSEVNALMQLLKKFLKSKQKELLENGIQLQAIGRLEKLPRDTRKLLLETMDKTASNNDLVLTLALSYGGRQEIVDAFRKITSRIERDDLSANEISEHLISDYLYTANMPDPDLLIRTSGEYRISNFLLWQIAYTEIYITPTLWPDFSKDEYFAAIKDFQGRERRFGKT